MDLTMQVKQLAKDLGADLVGVANVERFKNAPEGHKPGDLLPNARSVIVAAIGLGEGVASANRMAWKGNRYAIYPYMLYGYPFLNNILNTIAYQSMRLLEGQGFRTLPIPASPPNNSLEHMGAFSNRHAAVAAGLGEFGFQSLLITEKFGPRIRVVSVLTEAELEPDPLYQGGQICDVKSCNYLCVRECPVNALPKDEITSLQIEDRIFTYSCIDKWVCRLAVLGLAKDTLGRDNMEVPEGEMTPEIYLDLLKNENPWQKMEMSTVGRASLCGKCITFCPVGERGKGMVKEDA